MLYKALYFENTQNCELWSHHTKNWTQLSVITRKEQCQLERSSGFWIISWSVFTAVRYTSFKKQVFLRAKGQRNAHKPVLYICGEFGWSNAGTRLLTTMASIICWCQHNRCVSPQHNLNTTRWNLALRFRVVPLGPIHHSFSLNGASWRGWNWWWISRKYLSIDRNFVWAVRL